MKTSDLQIGHLYLGSDGVKRKLAVIKNAECKFVRGGQSVFQKMPLAQFAGLAKADVTKPPSLNLAK